MMRRTPPSGAGGPLGVSVGSPEEDVMDRDSTRGLVERLPDRVRELRPEQIFDALPQRAVELLPEAAQERLGRRRRRPRWLLIGVGIGLVVGAVWLALRLKSVLAPGFDDDYDEDEPLGEPLTYPASGSGSGWPEGARSSDHTETLSAGASSAAATSPPAPPAAPVRFQRPQDLEDATLAFPATAEPERPLPPDPKQALAGTVWAESADVAPAQPSEPAQRPPVPFTEGQAETNARLQLQQDALLTAFPGMTRGDIVESDGDLDRLSVILASKLGEPIEDVRAKVDGILSTGVQQQQADTGIKPDLSVPQD
jgi:hypothetical protein